MISQQLFWTVTILLGIGTFLIRFSFLGILGDRGMPDWVMAHLRYTAVAVFPALVTPMVLWPEVTGGCNTCSDRTHSPRRHALENALFAPPDCCERKIELASGAGGSGMLTGRSTMRGVRQRLPVMSRSFRSSQSFACPSEWI